MTLRRQSSQGAQAGEAAAAAAAAVFGYDEERDGACVVRAAADAAEATEISAATAKAAAVTRTQTPTAAKPRKQPSTKQKAKAAKALSKAAKAARKRSPRFVICVGLPGSGKSVRLSWPQAVVNSLVATYQHTHRPLRRSSCLEEEGTGSEQTKTPRAEQAALP